MKKTYTKMVAQILKSQERIAKERDRLRDIAEEAESLREDCDMAWQDLQCAIDKLSEQQ
jgi:DNA repair ATPase RecN